MSKQHWLCEFLERKVVGVEAHSDPGMLGRLGHVVVEHGGEEVRFVLAADFNEELWELAQEVRAGKVKRVDPYNQKDLGAILAFLELWKDSHDHAVKRGKPIC